MVLIKKPYHVRNFKVSTIEHTNLFLWKNLFVDQERAHYIFFCTKSRDAKQSKVKRLRKYKQLCCCRLHVLCVFFRCPQCTKPPPAKYRGQSNKVYKCQATLFNEGNQISPLSSAESTPMTCSYISYINSSAGKQIHSQQTTHYEHVSMIS